LHLEVDNRPVESDIAQRQIVQPREFGSGAGASAPSLHDRHESLKHAASGLETALDREPGGDSRTFICAHHGLRVTQGRSFCLSYEKDIPDAAPHL
jgi:hypothetical protein